MGERTDAARAGEGMVTGPTGADAGLPGQAASLLGSAVLERPTAFVRATGLVFHEIGPTRVTGHLDLGPEHHTPWGIVHGGVYASAVETAASVGATAAVAADGRVAVGLTNTTHFLHAMREGRVEVEALALYQGRTHQLWRVAISDASGRLVAHGELRVQNVPGDPAPANVPGDPAPANVPGVGAG